MAALYDGNGDRIFRLDYRKNSDYVSNKAGTAENVYYPTSSVNSAYDTDVILNEMLIPNGVTQNTAINYELTGYINDINTEYTQNLMEFGANGNTTNVYEYGAQRNSATINGTKGYYLYDGRGSVAGLTGSNSGSMITYRYDAYGNTTKSNNTLNNPYQYNAEYTDSSTGLQYLRARYYDSSQGRFTAKDTYLGTIPNPLSRNLYTYVENNPLNYIDPSGHVKVGKSIGASAANIARVTADAASIAKKTVSVASKGANYVAVANSPAATNAAKAKAKATYLQSKAALAVALAMKKACSVTDRAKDDGLTKSSSVTDFFTGLSYSFVSNVLIEPFLALDDILNHLGLSSGEARELYYFNTGNYDISNQSAYEIGKISGDVISFIIGEVEFVNGFSQIGKGALEVGGSVLMTATGQIEISVPALAHAVAGIVVGVGVTAVGGVTMFSSGKNLYSDINSYNTNKSKSYLSNRQANQIKDEILQNHDVRFKSKEQALEFIEKKFPDFKQETAGQRSSEGWHFDSHSINGSDEAIEHINIYSKKEGFRVHIFWDE